MDLSAGALATSLLVSTVGFGYYLYGKRESRIPPLAAGLAMMVCPYLVGSVLWNAVLAGGLVAGVWLAARAGW